MVERGPSRIGLVIMAVIYWGALFYWLRGDLLDGDAVLAEQRSFLWTKRKPAAAAKEPTVD